ncbi:MAG: Uncharacterized protein Rv2570/MT2646, partial [uncultured Corynebacteriales bacterium]
VGGRGPGGPRRGRARAGAGDAARDRRARGQREPGLPGRRQVVRLLPHAPAGRGRPGDRGALPGRHRVLGGVRGRQAGDGAGRHVAVLHDPALRRAPLGAAARLPGRRADPAGAGRGRPGRLALPCLRPPGRRLAPGPRPAARPGL